MSRLYDQQRWRRGRLAFLAAHPLCTVCAARGRTTVATQVDHIAPHRDDLTLFWDTSNWQGLCHRCHSAKTAREDAPASFGSYQRIPYFVKRPAVPVHIVCGPPASGKSTYVDAQRANRSTVIDVDVIASELTGQPVHHVDMRRWLPDVMRERNDRLAQLAGKHCARTYDEAWLVVTAPRLNERRRWITVLSGVTRATVTVLETAAQVCHARLEHQRTRANLIGVHKAIDRWWSTYTADPFSEHRLETSS